MSFLQDVNKTASGLLKDVTKTIRHFTTFVLVVFALGLFLGARTQLPGTPFDISSAILFTLALAIGSYLFTEVAIVFFVLFVFLAFLL
ncbi:MAG TPA: hypothetical protein VGQ00_00015 [Candidatus Norongarragalinales archaeon]|jgi:ABC-type microcin C transport system permease subunit YejB|nr:hypothetical protein [Candidatus Norongarragalinales archaeon]